MRLPRAEARRTGGAEGDRRVFTGGRRRGDVDQRRVRGGAGGLVKIQVVGVVSMVDAFLLSVILQVRQ